MSTIDWLPFPEVSHVVTLQTIRDYAEISGDTNPLHLDPAYAARTRFGSVIAHGPIGLQTVFEALARWLGTTGLPDGVSVQAAYRAPVRPGDTISCRAEDVLEHAGALALAVRCVNQDDETVIEALITVPRGQAPRVES